MHEYYRKRLETRLRGYGGRGTVVEVAVVIAGSIGFGHWQGSTGAGWWMFAVLCAIDELGSQIGVGIASLNSSK